MVYSYGGRVDNDSNAITKIDEENRTAETKGFINGEYVEFSGGGGSSDFSTATVTVVNNTQSGLILPVVYNANEMGPDSPAVLSVVEVAYEGDVKVALFKGGLLIEIPLDNVTISGDIRNIGDSTYFITGDCTITIS